MTELVNLVVANGLHRHDRLDLLEVVLRCRKNGNARAGIRDLRGRCKIENHVLAAGLAALLENIQQLVAALLIELVHNVSVVPENAEIGGCGGQGRQTTNSVIRIGHAVGIGILGVAPDALDGGIVVDKFLNGIHVGTRGGHGNRDHFNTKRLADRKVAIVTGCRANKLQFLLTAPGSLAAPNAVKHCAGNRIVHEVERRIAPDEKIALGQIKQLGKETLDLGDAV